MSKEAVVSVTINIQKVDPTTGIRQINYTRNETNVNDVNAGNGPYTGTVIANTTGVFISVSVGGGSLGWAVFTNQDLANVVYIGLYDNSNGRFSPLIRLLPGMTNAILLPEKLDEWSGIAPGTTSVSTDQLMAKTRGGNAAVRCDIFPD